MSISCPNCGEIDTIEVDSALGSSACSSCGLLLSENNIVSEVGFVEGSNGVSSVIGQFVPSSGPRSLSSTGRGVPVGHTRESRENTIMNAKRRISNLASVLTGINAGIVEAAVKYFNMALSHNFVQGRRSANVAAACLYVACRRARTAHMLMDFSDALSVNVFVLGATVLRFLRTVSIKLPFTDPSLYMSRFANSLPFGAHTHAVANTALRLLAHMKRDWLQTGRRPSGICGACLFLAARMHNFQCSLQEVAQTVRIGEMTIQRRLQELSNTSTASLSAEDVEALSLEGDVTKIVADGAQADPPAFQRLQLKEEKKRRLRALLRDKPDLPALLGLTPTPGSAHASTAESESVDVSEIVDVSLEGLLHQMGASLRTSPVLGELYSELRRAAETGTTADIATELDFLPPEPREGDAGAESSELDGQGGAAAAPTTASDSDSRLPRSAPLSRPERLQLRLGASVDAELLEAMERDVVGLSLPASVARQAAVVAAGGAEGDVDALLSDAHRNPLLVAAALAGSLPERLAELEAARARMLERAVHEIELYRVELARHDFSDLDERELDTWVLDDAARDQKMRLWEHMHREHLIDEENKRRLGTTTRKPGVAGERRSARKVTGARGERKVSDKLNYEALRLIQGLDVDLDLLVAEDAGGVDGAFAGDARVGVAPTPLTAALAPTPGTMLAAKNEREERRARPAQSQSQSEAQMQVASLLQSVHVRPLKASQEPVQLPTHTPPRPPRMVPTKAEADSGMATKAERDGDLKSAAGRTGRIGDAQLSAADTHRQAATADAASLEAVLAALDREEVGAVGTRVKPDSRTTELTQASALLGAGNKRGTKGKGPAPKKPKL